MRLLIGPGGPSPVANTLQPLLAYPDFRALWWSTLFASSAWWGQNVVLLWLAFDITDSEFAVSAAAAAGLAPMLLGPVGGLLADRLHRPRLLIGAQALGLATGAVIALLVTLGWAEYWHIVVASGLVGLTMQPLMPTRFTLTIDLVGERRVSSANALTAVGMLGSRMVVPVAAGALIATFGADVALWFSAAWYLPASWPLLRVGEARRSPRSAMTAAPAEIAHGFRYALASPALRALLLVTVLANILAWPVIIGFLPVFAEEVFDVGAAGLGLIVGVNGLGSLLAAIAIAAWGDFRWKGMVYLLATVLLGVALAAFALSGGFAFALLLIFIAGLGGSGFGVMQSTVTMLLAPAEARGRVLGVLMVSIGVLPGATLVLGAAASSVGVVTTTAASGLLLAVLTIAITAVSPELRRAR
ncbi:MAG: MFS transporter [Chloroflexi bacterium]|nr:MFS transporter [Chloroflexota bacterium]